MVLSKQNFLKRFGKRIKQARKKTGLSQEKLAHSAGIHRTYMGRIERGESNPPIYSVYKIARALKTKVFDFLSFL
jgi:transcriptional regulator with XRE-family HTH domain